MSYTHITTSIITTTTASKDYALSSLGFTPDKLKLCFHIPPWNSIDHLHLHLICEPETLSTFGKMKYLENSMYCKSADEILNNLKTSGVSVVSGNGGNSGVLKENNIKSKL